MPSVEVDGDATSDVQFDGDGEAYSANSSAAPNSTFLSSHGAITNSVYSETWVTLRHGGFAKCLLTRNTIYACRNATPQQLNGTQGSNDVAMVVEEWHALDGVEETGAIMAQAVPPTGFEMQVAFSPVHILLTYNTISLPKVHAYRFFRRLLCHHQSAHCRVRGRGQWHHDVCRYPFDSPWERFPVFQQPCRSG